MEMECTCPCQTGRRYFEAEGVMPKSCLLKGERGQACQEGQIRILHSTIVTKAALRVAKCITISANQPPPLAGDGSCKQRGQHLKDPITNANLCSRLNAAGFWGGGGDTLKLFPNGLGLERALSFADPAGRPCAPSRLKVKARRIGKNRSPVHRRGDFLPQVKPLVCSLLPRAALYPAG